MSGDGYRKCYAFSEQVQKEICARQKYRCAVCGKHLGHWKSSTLSNIHHVVPAIAGNPSNPDDDFIRSEDNGVLVCDDSPDPDKGRSEYCHGKVAHGQGRFKSFAAYLHEFPYSHGGDTAAHAVWSQVMSKRKPSKW